MRKTESGEKRGAADLVPLLTIAELAKYLHLNVGSVYHMLPRITAADGKMRVGRAWRFDLKRVQPRLEAGLFARGLDEFGNGNEKREGGEDDDR